MGKLLVAGMAVLGEYGAAFASLLAFLADASGEHRVPGRRSRQRGGVAPGTGTRVQPLG
jgi:hypothetical protein